MTFFKGYLLVISVKVSFLGEFQTLCGCPKFDCQKLEFRANDITEKPNLDLDYFVGVPTCSLLKSVCSLGLTGG